MPELAKNRSLSRLEGPAFPGRWMLCALLAPAIAGVLSGVIPVSAASPHQARTSPRAHSANSEAASEESLPESAAFEVLPPAGRADRSQAAEVVADEAAVAALGTGWSIERTGGTSGALRLHGPGLTLDAQGDAQGATQGNAPALRALLARLPQWFGDRAVVRLEADSAEGLAPVPGARTVRLHQFFEGARVRGADITAHFDTSGRLVSIQSGGRADARPVNTRLVSSEDAERIAREDLAYAYPGLAAGAPRPEAWIWPEADGPRHVWLVRQTALGKPALFATRIDAQSGAVLGRWDIAQQKLRVGDAYVYRSNADYPDAASMARVRDLFGAERNPEGRLSGAHFEIVDAKGNGVASPSLEFEYGPWSAADSFDQVGAYYHLEKARLRWARELGLRAAPWQRDGAPVRARVNSTEFCGAFYTSDLEGDGFPGFDFSDENTCAPGQPDFSRDSDVIYHEFSHAALDWSGIDLALAEPNSYQRAISEADADYHAANFTGDPVLGEVVGNTRDVDNAKTYPADVPCDPYGFMEEHCTGEIWSGFLWALQSAIGPEAEKLEVASLDYLSDNWPDGHVRGVIDFWDATFALLQADRDLYGGAYGGLIYGAATSRGFFGPNTHGEDQVSVVFEKLGRATKFKSIGWVYTPTQRVPYFFRAPAGSEVTIHVRSTSTLQPTLSLSEMGASSSRKIVGAVTSTGREAVLRAPLHAGSQLYLLEVYPAVAGSGTFQLSIAVK